MSESEHSERYIPMLNLDLIRRALDGTDVEKARRHMDEIVEYKPGDLIQYKTKDRGWIDGVVVAWMIHNPSYVCGPGDDRENTGDSLLGCSREYVRPR